MQKYAIPPTFQLPDGGLSSTGSKKVYRLVACINRFFLSGASTSTATLPPESSLGCDELAFKLDF